MFKFCTQCGRQSITESGICDDCAAGSAVRETTRLDERQTVQQPVGGPIQKHSSQAPQTDRRCQWCGGADGVFLKSEITPAGFVYLAVMVAITLALLMIFFPCALIPFALIFLVFLFKKKYFACVNCGQQVN